MSRPAPLAPAALYHTCDPSQLGFASTDELEPLDELIGQARALEAIRFGVGMRRSGFNLYVMGPAGLGKHSLVAQQLDRQARHEPTPPDLCYVHNFEQPHRPEVLQLPPGEGAHLQGQMQQLIEELTNLLPASFDSEEYQEHRQALEDELKRTQEEAFSALAERAAEHDIKLFRTPSGFAFAPMREQEALSPEAFQQLPEDEQTHIGHQLSALQEELEAIIKRIPQWRKETKGKVKALNREVTMAAVGHLIGELRAQFAATPRVLDYLDTVQRDIIDNVKDFLKPEDGIEQPGQGEPDPTALHRYKVNLLVDHGQSPGAPVVYLDNPSYLNLMGRAEHLAQFGTLVTDFTLLKPGALHQASGGYLLLDAQKLLTQPFAWEGLKRALYSNEIRIESLEKMLSMASTVTLEPAPVPLDVKVVLIGDRTLYYMLHEYDPDFGELFKVAADFEERIDRTPENSRLYARLIATLARKERLLPFDVGAVARLIEEGSRLEEDSEKLTTHMRSVVDLMHEADYWARQSGHERVCREDIQQAVARAMYRASRVRERLHEEVERGTLLIDTRGAKVGQVNGLSVLAMGSYEFGQASRITATVHIGEGQLIDIEREVDLGGTLHSKGVMILSALLAARYAKNQPLSLSASLVFEQNYGYVDGDSASCAEFCCLISAIAEVPIYQHLAITGSVNQHGEVQAIGGVNAKIEGFFDLCVKAGLSGEQGVIIPYSNIKHLMLDEGVVQAVAAGQFHIYAVRSVDEALALLTGQTPGEADPDGDYPEETLNGKVHARLTEMTLIRADFVDQQKEKRKGKGKRKGKKGKG